MAKIKWKAGNMVYPLPAAMVSCGTKEEDYNIITIAWTGTICTNPAMTYISIRPGRHSYKIIKESGAFVINLTTEALAYATDYCGVKSGRDEDKAQFTGLTYEATEIGAPLIKESPVNILCQVTEIKELGSHDMFMAKVVSIYVDDQYMDENEKFHLDQTGIMAYSHGGYYALGDRLGTFGYSIRKKKTRKNSQRRSKPKASQGTHKTRHKPSKKK